MPIELWGKLLENVLWEVREGG